MKKIAELSLIALLLAAPLLAYAAVTGISFGGKVTSIQPCNTGILAYLTTSKGPVPVMWFWGNLPFLSYLPPHSGQQLLGKMGQSLVPCVSGTVPSGAGFPILFHGSSL